MHIDRSIREADYKTIAVMVAILAGTIGLIGFALHDGSIDASQVEPIQTSHATMLSTVPLEATPVQTSEVAPAAPVTPENNQAADESSYAMRPEAAH